MWTPKGNQNNTAIIAEESFLMRPFNPRYIWSLITDMIWLICVVFCWKIFSGTQATIWSEVEERDELTVIRAHADLIQPAPITPTVCPLSKFPTNLSKPWVSVNHTIRQPRKLREVEIIQMREPSIIQPCSHELICFNYSPSCHQRKRCSQLRSCLSKNSLITEFSFRIPKLNRNSIHRIKSRKLLN